MQLNKIHTLSATLELITGLTIGDSNSSMQIGGIDKNVIKHPYTLEPYIPGSSLKGKMRSLLEWRAGVVGETGGKPVTAKVLKKLEGEKLVRAETIARLFGLSGDAQDDFIKEIGPTRLSFWDCSLNTEWIESYKTTSLTEVKAETAIDRIAGTAQNGSLRFTERVPAGACFDFKLSFKELDIDTDLLTTILQGLKLLELDAIGGSGSRGYGKIKFVNLKLNEESIAEQFEKTDPFA